MTRVLILKEFHRQECSMEIKREFLFLPYVQSRKLTEANMSIARALRCMCRLIYMFFTAGCELDKKHIMPDAPQCTNCSWLVLLKIGPVSRG